jgi:hypothetical protein
MEPGVARDVRRAAERQRPAKVERRLSVGAKRERRWLALPSTQVLKTWSTRAGELSRRRSLERKSFAHAAWRVAAVWPRAFAAESFRSRRQPR